MKTRLLLCIYILLCYNLYSQTYIGGSIFSNTTWTLSSSPYIVTSDIVVFDAATLTIEPGVVVKFNPGTGMQLRGVLSSIGTISDSIEFTSSLPSPIVGSWNGITVTGSSSTLPSGSQVTMEYCIGSYSQYFINLDLAYAGPYMFRNCLFSFNVKTNFDGGLPFTNFEYCAFENSTEGLSLTQFDSRVSNSRFINNGNGVFGISVTDSCYFSGNSGVALSPLGVARFNVLENNDVGANIGAGCLFLNNLVANNRIGVRLNSYSNGSSTFLGNTICSNADYNIENLYISNADLADNCWCTTDSLLIRASIYDGYVNNLYGLVSFSPLSDSCVQLNLGNVILIKSNQSQFVLYPNPTNGDVTIENFSDKKCLLKIFDLNGNFIFSEFIERSKIISTDKLPNGIYILEVDCEKNNLYRKKLVLIE